MIDGPRRPRRAPAVLALAMLLMSCGDGGGDPVGPPAATLPHIEPVGSTERDGQVGQAVAPLVVRTVTGSGEPAGNVAVAFAVTAGGGTVSPATVTTGADGRATAQWTLGPPAGAQTAEARVGTHATIAFRADAAPGPATRLRMLTPPGEARVAAVLGTAPVIAVADAFDNPVLGHAGDVTVELASGGGTLIGMVRAPLVNGVATLAGLELTGAIGPRSLRFSAAGLAPLTANLVLLPPARSTADRADDIAGPQFHVVYVLPSDAADRNLDTTTALAYSIAVFQNWLAHKAGLALRMDTYRGAVDVTFFRLSSSDSVVIRFGAFVRDEIERQLRAAGLLRPDRIYLAYYDGGSSHACGGASWPPQVEGQLAAMYLRGTPGGVQCGAQSFADAPDAAPGYWEFAMLHDAVHTLGIVGEAAPNHTAAYYAHVPEPHDLMFSGPQPWLYGPQMVVDVGADDYFGAAVAAALPNLAATPFVVPATATRPMLDATRSAWRRGGVPFLEPPPHPPFQLLRKQDAR